MGFSNKLPSDHLHWGQTLPLDRPPPEPLKCPRCGSANTKFCYYNNYNKSQPRHFCKACKRHWTKGGTLRNVPLGGGRKNKRPQTTTSAKATLCSNGNANGDHQKVNMAGILYQAMIRSSPPLLHQASTTTDGISVSVPGKPLMGSKGMCSGLSASAVPLNTSADFEFAGLSTDLDASLIYDQNMMSSYGCENLDPIEESSVTSVGIVHPSSWVCPDAGSTLDLPNYWDEIEALTSDDLNAAWDNGDDAVVKS